MTKRKRAQPRSKTPPIGFRCEGEPAILMLDEEMLTTAHRAISRSRMPIFLDCGPGLRLVLGSRRFNKRRYPYLYIDRAPNP